LVGFHTLTVDKHYGAIVKISELIDKLNEVKSIHGDIEVLHRDQNEFMSIQSCEDVVFEFVDGEDISYPDEYNMPAGSCHAVIESFEF
jgi:hypothetical protein